MFPYSEDVIVFIMRQNIDGFVLLCYVFTEEIAIMLKLSNHMAYC